MFDREQGPWCSCSGGWSSVYVVTRNQRLYFTLFFAASFIYTDERHLPYTCAINVTQCFISCVPVWVFILCVPSNSWNNSFRSQSWKCKDTYETYQTAVISSLFLTSETVLDNAISPPGLFSSCCGDFNNIAWSSSAGGVCSVVLKTWMKNPQSTCNRWKLEQRATLSADEDHAKWLKGQNSS